MAETTPPMAPVFVLWGRLRTIKREREKERTIVSFQSARETMRTRIWCNPNSKRATNNEICERARLDAFVGALGVKKQRNRGTEIEKKEKERTG
jgi:hypothetical protein